MACHQRKSKRMKQDNMAPLAMIAAVGPNRELGIKGDLVWHISADLKRFKQLTMGHPVVMGRKTWESLPKRPLPGRLNIVLSRSAEEFPGAVKAANVEEAIRASEGEEAPFVMGGEQIYSAFMLHATVLYLTKVDADAPEGVDAWFPEYEEDWRLAEASDWETDPKGIRYRFETWARR